MKKAYIFAILSVFCWSTVSTAFKISLVYLTPLGLLLFSSLFASAVLLFYNLVASGKGFNNNRFNILSNIRASLLPGLLNPFVYYLVLFAAYNRLRAQEAQVLNYTWAIVLSVMVLIVFKQKFRIMDMTALVFSFVGVIVIATKGEVFSLSFDNPYGSFLALGSSFIWAWYWIITMQDKRMLQSRLLFNFMVGTVYIGLYVLIMMIVGYNTSLFIDGSVGIKWGLLGALYVGIFEMGLTFLLWNTALSSGDNTASIANLIFFTPFISLIFISLILKEQIHSATIIGLAIIVLSNLAQKSKVGRNSLLDRKTPV